MSLYFIIKFKNMKRKAQTFHFVEEKQEEEFHLPKFKSDVLKTRDDRD